MSVQVDRLGALLPKGGLLDERTWRLRHHVLFGLLAIHLPILVIVGMANRQPGEQIVLELVPIGLLLAAGWFVGNRRVAALGVTAGLIACSMALIHFTNGLIEAHFHYFVMLGFIALYQDWWCYLVAVGLVVANHVFGIAVPEALYNHAAALDDPVTWGVIHGGFVLLLAIGNIFFWKVTESEQVRSRTYYQQLYESERALADRLREAEQLKKELVAVVSHEFRTPLTSILGFAQTLSARIAEFDQANALLCADRIERQAKRLSRLVHNLLAASGDVQIEPGQSTDLYEVVTAVVEDLVEAWPHADHRIEVVVPRGLRIAMGADPAHQIAVNLIDNALKFAQPETSVHVRARRLNDSVVLEVANVGAPIPPEARERIFEPFMQLDSSDTRNFEGIGLGLAIVRKLVQAHDGTIEVLGDGPLIVFRIIVPTSAAANGDEGIGKPAVQSVQVAAH